MVLNCNHTSGDIITSKYARIRFLQIQDSIFNLYYEYMQKDGFYYPNITIPISYSDNVYELFWYMFFLENPALLKEILRYDSYIDNHGSELISTARVFQILKKGGINGLKLSCRKLRRYIAENKSQTEFDEIVMLARKCAEGQSSCNINTTDNNDIIKKLITLYKDKNITDEYIRLRELDIYKQWNCDLNKKKECIIDI